MAIDTSEFKKKLISEKERLERELGSVGRINPENKDDWEPTAGGLNNDKAEIEERASEITDFEERSAVEFELEKRLNEVRDALERVDNGSYGRCIVDGGESEAARLFVNPAARSCRAHME